MLQQWVAPFRNAGQRRANEPAHREAEEIRRSEGSRRKGGKSSKLDRTKAFESNERRMRAISDLIRVGDIDRAREYIGELVESQLANGGAQYAVKSLCSLAKEAKERGLFSLQHDLTQWSVELKPDDGWAWTQYGDALLCSLRPSEALAAYEKAGTLGGGVVTKTGRAEVLKSLGRLDAALDAYDSVIAEYPADAFARNGRASLLGAMGLYEEALEWLPSSMPVTAQDWIGYHIRGMVLSLMGRDDEAMQVFEEGIRSDPIPRSRDYFRTAMALAQLRRNRIHDASSTLAEIDSAESTLRVPVGILRLHTFGALGRREDAGTAYRTLSDVSAPRLILLRDELHRRYLEDEAPEYDDDWVFGEETRCLLMAA